MRWFLVGVALISELLLTGINYQKPEEPETVEELDLDTQFFHLFKRPTLSREDSGAESAYV